MLLARPLGEGSVGTGARAPVSDFNLRKQKRSLSLDVGQIGLLKKNNKIQALASL